MTTEKELLEQILLATANDVLIWRVGPEIPPKYYSGATGDPTSYLLDTGKAEVRLITPQNGNMVVTPESPEQYQTLVDTIDSRRVAQEESRKQRILADAFYSLTKHSSSRAVPA